MRIVGELLAEGARFADIAFDDLDDGPAFVKLALRQATAGKALLRRFASGINILWPFDFLSLALAVRANAIGFIALVGNAFGRL